MLRPRRPSPGHLSLLVEQLPQSFVWTTDCELRLTSVAGAALSILGLESGEEVVGRPLATVIGPTVDHAEEIVDAHRRALSGESATFTEPWRKWAFDVHVEPLREGGKVVGVGGIALDASKRFLAERALAESEARFRTLVERLPALVTYVNPLGFPIRTTYISPQIEGLLGFPAERWTSEDDFWVSLLHPDDRDRVLEYANRTHEAGDSFRAEYRLVAADGRVVHVRDETVPVSDERGRPLFLQGFLLEVDAA
ncbi:MAG TPA: PAS domain-containing protein [Gaiellaceae bacterium]|nr:PAS domain-containing protein [Gaiellaceae bacterium]